MTVYKEGWIGVCNSENGPQFRVSGKIGSQGLIEYMKESELFKDPELQQKLEETLKLARKRVDRYMIRGGLLGSGGEMQDLPELNEDQQNELNRRKLWIASSTTFSDKGILFDLKHPIPQPYIALAAPGLASYLHGEVSRAKTIQTRLYLSKIVSRPGEFDRFDSVKSALARHLDEYVLRPGSLGEIRPPYAGHAVMMQRLFELSREVGIGGRTTLEALAQAQQQNKETLQKAG